MPLGKEGCRYHDACLLLPTASRRLLFALRRRQACRHRAHAAAATLDICHCLMAPGLFCRHDSFIFRRAGDAFLLEALPLSPCARPPPAPRHAAAGAARAYYCYEPAHAPRATRCLSRHAYATLYVYAASRHAACLMRCHGMPIDGMLRRYAAPAACRY